MNNQEQKIRFAILDPLRMVAALAVVFYHFSIYFDDKDSFFANLAKFGYLGVNFFFLLSGFVIMSSAQNRGAFEFAFARALRIYPAFIICLLFTVATTYLLGGEKYSFAEIIANASILNDYLGIPNIDGVYWTLQAELKFYGCVFLLLLSGAFTYWRYWLSAWLVLAITYFFWQQPFFLGWFINPAYSFYFIGGVSAYLLYKNYKDRQVQLIFIVSLVFGYFTALDQAQNFIASVTYENRVVAGITVVVFYIFFALMARGYFNVKKTSALILLGAMSYPLYLIHNKAGKEIYKYLAMKISPELAMMLAISLVFGVSCCVVFFERRVQIFLNGKEK